MVVFPVPRGPVNKYASAIALFAQRVAERPHDMLLSDDVRKQPRTPLPIQRNVRHRSYLPGNRLYFRQWHRPLSFSPLRPAPVRERHRHDDSRNKKSRRKHSTGRTKMSRAPAVDLPLRTLPEQLTRTRRPRGTRHIRLPLLPSGPDGVHEGPLRETRSSTSLTRAGSTKRSLGREFNPAIADCGYRAPLPPRLARPHLKTL